MRPEISQKLPISFTHGHHLSNATKSNTQRGRVVQDLIDADDPAAPFDLSDEPGAEPQHVGNFLLRVPEQLPVLPQERPEGRVVRHPGSLGKYLTAADRHENPFLTYK